MSIVNVFFDGHNVTSYVTSVAKDVIEMTCPDLPAGEYLVTVLNSTGVSNAVGFTIIEDLDPFDGFTHEKYHVERANNRLLHQYKKPNGR